MVMPDDQTKAAIASDIRPGDDPTDVSKKLVGGTRTQLLHELFGYFDIPSDFINHVFGNLYARDVLTQRERELCAVAALCVLNRTNELKSHIIAAIRTGAGYLSSKFDSQLVRESLVLSFISPVTYYSIHNACSRSPLPVGPASPRDVGSWVSVQVAPYL